MNIGRVYQHFKGNYYEVVDEVFNVETKRPMVVYKPLYECEHRFFVRDKEEFYGQVVSMEDKMSVPRFKRVEMPQCLS